MIYVHYLNLIFLVFNLNWELNYFFKYSQIHGNSFSKIELIVSTFSSIQITIILQKHRGFQGVSLSLLQRTFIAQLLWK